MPERNPYNPGEPDNQMQLRTMIAFALMAVVLLAMPYFFKTGLPQQPVKNAKTQPVKRTGQNATPATSLPAAAPATGSSGAVAAHDQQQVVVETSVYRVVYSNRGGVASSWTLKKYPNAAGKPLEVINSTAEPKYRYPFAYEFRGTAPPVDLNEALFVATKTPDGLGVDFTFSENGVTAKKSFRFTQAGYLTQVSSEVTQNGNPVQHLVAWHGGFGDFAVQNASSIQREIRYSVPDSKLQNDAPKAAKNGPVSRDGDYSFVGLEDQYFAAVFLPKSAGNVETEVFDDYVPTPYDKSEQQFIGTAVGGRGDNQLELFVGPKDIDFLRQVNPKLEQIVDFGWFWFLAKPLFLVLRWVNHDLVHNYGWSIILVTVFINFALFPLRLTNMKSMRKMQALQPDIQKINDKYKNIPMRDPRMAQKNEETMALYKKHGANPMGGCIPLAIQMPFLFAFYKVLAVSIEMRGAHWLWVTDLSQPEHLAIRILPVVLIITSFLMQRMTPTTGMDPSQARMMMFMPLIMGFFFYNQSSGLVLYWLTGNLMGIAQQWFFNKTIPRPVVVVAQPAATKAAVRRTPVRK